jgi:hypothetical protein
MKRLKVEPTTTTISDVGKLNKNTVGSFIKKKTNVPPIAPSASQETKSNNNLMSLMSAYGDDSDSNSDES